MSDAVGARGIVVAHGVMARGMVDAVRRIAGDAADALEPLSNDGLGPRELAAVVEAAAGTGPVIVFSDLVAGSCALAAFSSCRTSANRAVLCGVNLPILLDFVFHRDMPLEALVGRLVEKGRQGILPLPASR